jgi:hypothetical protein
MVASGGEPAAAAILPLPTEQLSWSDMSFQTGVSGSYNATTNVLTISASPSSDLEIGVPFGPGEPPGIPDRHYGTDGTLGGPFSATLNVSGVVVDEAGIVTNGGTFTVTFNGSAPGSVGADYGILAGSQLLVGTVLEVLLGDGVDDLGDNYLDVLVDVSGGALQNDNPDPDVGVFAPNGRAVIRIAAASLPNDWNGNFSLDGSTINLLGIPEPGALALSVLGLGLVGASRSRRRVAS